MLRKIFQNVLLVIIVGIIITLTAKSTIFKDEAVDNITLFLMCIVVSSIIVFLINRLLGFMSEIMYLSSPLSKIDKMSGEEFERYLMLRFKKLGYKVEITPKSGDYGADLFCFNKNETVVVQAKRYEANVGTAAVQEVVGARDYYEADICVVITNSYFTINALNLSEADNVVLIDRDELLNFDYDRIHRL